jgi:hypothetical protein
MDNYELRKLAGLTTSTPTTLTEKKWSGEVEPKTHPAEGTFTKKAAAVVKELMKVHNGDAGKAMKALNFFMNRAGEKLENKAELEKAKEMLHAKVKMEDINAVRRRAGLPIIVEKKDEDEELEMNDDGGEEKDDAKAEEEEEEELPAIIKKIAKAMAKKFGFGSPEQDGKDVDDAEEMLMKVYQAGLKDGAKEGKEGKEKPAKDEAE